MVNICGWSDATNDILMGKMCGEEIDEEDMKELGIPLRKFEAKRRRVLVVTRRAWGVWRARRK